MIELTKEKVYDAMELAKKDQDEIIRKAKEKNNGPKETRTVYRSPRRVDGTV